MPLKLADQNEHYDEKIVTADLEAIINPTTGSNCVYMAAWYNGSLVHKNKPINQRTFSINDYGFDQDRFIRAFWKDIIKNNEGRTCYFHNWGGYDSILSLPQLLSLNSMYSFNPIMKEGELMSLDITQGTKRLLSIKDSIRILPSSLSKLAKDYKVPTQKEHFPHYFFLNNIQETLYYIGSIPPYQCFEPKRTSPEDYKEMVEEFSNKSWSFLDFLFGFQVINYQRLKPFT